MDIVLLNNWFTGIIILVAGTCLAGVVTVVVMQSRKIQLLKDIARTVSALLPDVQVCSDYTRIVAATTAMDENLGHVSEHHLDEVERLLSPLKQVLAFQENMLLPLMHLTIGLRHKDMMQCRNGLTVLANQCGNGRLVRVGDIVTRLLPMEELGGPTSPYRFILDLLETHCLVWGEALARSLVSNIIYRPECSMTHMDVLVDDLTFLYRIGCVPKGVIETLLTEVNEVLTTWVAHEDTLKRLAQSHVAEASDEESGGSFHQSITDLSDRIASFLNKQ